MHFCILFLGVMKNRSTDFSTKLFQAKYFQEMGFLKFLKINFGTLS